MAWDSSTTLDTRRRGNSTTSIKPTNILNHQEIIPKSTHTADPALQPFLSSIPFDPAAYLNATLPALSTSGSTFTRSSTAALPLSELSTQTQTLLSHLSAHTTRLTNTLTQLTDEILRSGSRLAYEVEVLRGETVGLSEALTETLAEDITKFVPDGLEPYLAAPAAKPAETSGVGRRRRSSTVSRVFSSSQPTTPRIPSQPTTPKIPNTPGQPPSQDVVATEIQDPEFIQNLRTLTLVRQRLDSVIQTFGLAMSWTFPPSEISVTSSFLSVSAPAPETNKSTSAHFSLEEKGQETSRKLRNEILELLEGNGGDAVGRARERVGELRDLGRVWRGTVEERGRVRFVDGLENLVEERERDIGGVVGDVVAPERVDEGRGAAGNGNGNGNADGRFGGGFDLFNRLQSLRGGAS